VDPTKVHSPNTHLKDRVLWFDGDSAYTPEQILQAIKTRDIQYVSKITPLIEQYNKVAPPSKQLRVKTDIRPLSFEWTIPNKYKQIDVVSYLSTAHALLFEGITSAEMELRELRLAQELTLYRKYGLYDVLRAVIWIINTLTAEDTVWGVGRGSSVSSYVLYVIGVHDVDSFSYGLDIDDFLHE
jgi:DNA polymerase III alpha subunit